MESLNVVQPGSVMTVWSQTVTVSQIAQVHPVYRKYDVIFKQNVKHCSGDRTKVGRN